MNNDVKELAYFVLQDEYLKRKNIENSEENLKQIISIFPSNWFIKYSLDTRIKIISIALKNNIDLEEALVINDENKFVSF